MSIPSKEKQRIEWIDIAKGIAILLVIIGHTVKFGSLSRNIIFSFHMPLFFILSGYTFRPATDAKTFFKHLRKNFLHLILPCLGVSLFLVTYNTVKADCYDIYTIKTELFQMGRNLFYASGVNFNGTAAGAIWFIFSLFWSKTIIDCIYSFQKNNFQYVTIGCLTFFGVWLGTTHHWQIQNLDVTLVALIFLYAGIFWRTHEKQIEKYTGSLFFISLATWSFLIYHGIYIEMATRQYPMYSVSVIEAILASFVFSLFCKALLGYHLAPPHRYIALLGADSIIIFYLHHCDWIIREFWFVEGHTKHTIFFRIAYILVAYLIILIFRRIVKYFKNKTQAS